MVDHSTDDTSPSGFVTRLWIVPALALLFPSFIQVLTAILEFTIVSFLASFLVTLFVGILVLVAVPVLIIAGETSIKERGILAAIFARACGCCGGHVLGFCRNG